MKRTSISTTMIGTGTALALLGLAFGCSPGGSPGAALVGPGPLGALGVPAAMDGLRTPPTFDPTAFVSEVNHPFFPLVPGTAFRYAGNTADGLETTVVEVLTERKDIVGVAALVVRDRVYLDGELIEDTLDWYAQDRAGNVWYLGEDVKNYDHGVVTSTEGSWEAGRNGAVAGIVMEAQPRPGDKYLQEFAPGIAEDMASVVSIDETATVPYGSFEECVKTMEFTRLSPGSRGYKVYARGVGLVLEDSPRGGHERVELISRQP